MKITEKIYDVTSGEETFLEREETKEETQFRLNVAKVSEIATQKAMDKAAVLTQLGITEEQAKLLLG